MELNGNEVPWSIIIVDKTTLLNMWRKKNCIVKRAAKQVPRDKATSNLTPEVLHVNNID